MPQIFLFLPLYFHALTIQQFSTAWLSSVPLKQSAISSKQCCSPHAVRIVLRVPQNDHLVSLHWLSNDSWIQYKLTSLCYNCLNLNAPVYLTLDSLHTNPPATLFSRYFHSLSSLCVHTLTWSEIFFMLHRLSETVSHAKLDHQTHSHLLNHLWNLTSSSCSTFCLSLCARARACVCVCVFAEVCFDCILFFSL